MADWATLLGEGDFAGARAACQQKIAGRADSPEASWELAEVEERWGDSLFFAGETGAAEHYHAARTALVPPGRSSPHSRRTSAAWEPTIA